MTPAPTADWRTIPDILNAQADARAKAPALFGTDGTFVNYEVLRNETQALASTLSALGPQETRLRMGVVMPNGLDISVVLLAAARQSIAVPFNPARTAVEFEAQFTATTVDYVLVPADVQTPALGALRLCPFRLLSSQWIARLKRRRPRTRHKNLQTRMISALILMTSGSTTMPKIVPLSQRNLCRSALDVAHSLALTPQDKCLVLRE